MFSVIRDYHFPRQADGSGRFRSECFLFKCTLNRISLTLFYALLLPFSVLLLGFSTWLLPVRLILSLTLWPGSALISFSLSVPPA